MFTTFLHQTGHFSLHNHQEQGCTWEVMIAIFSRMEEMHFQLSIHMHLLDDPRLHLCCAGTRLKCAVPTVLIV